MSDLMIAPRASPILWPYSWSSSLSTAGNSEIVAETSVIFPINTNMFFVTLSKMALGTQSVGF